MAVADGFTGNTVLKLYEGTAQTMKGVLAVGSTGAKATRFTPFMRLTSMVAPTVRAPLLPALAKASLPEEHEK